MQLLRGMHKFAFLWVLQNFSLERKCCAMDLDLFHSQQSETIINYYL